MTRKTLTEEERLADEARWRAIRPIMVSRQLLEPLVDFENELRIVTTLLNPEANLTKSFVARFHERPNPEQARVAFEHVVATAEQVCRHMRKEKSSSRAYYEQAVLQPKLDRLANPSPLREPRTRQYSGSAQTQHRLAQSHLMEQLRDNLQGYAVDFGKKVNADTLWNAYRMDFRGLDSVQFNEHAFVQAFPKTMDVIRPLARVYRLEKTLRSIEGGTQEQIIAAAQKLRDILPQTDVLRTEPFKRQLDFLAEAKVDLSSVELRSTWDEKQAEAASAEFADMMHRYVEVLKDEIHSQNTHFGKTGESQRLQQVYAQNFRKELLAAYKADVKSLSRKNANGDVTNQEEMNIALRSAPHIEPMISYLRAQAALTKLDGVVEKSGRAIISLYDKAPVQTR